MKIAGSWKEKKKLNSHKSANRYLRCRVGFWKIFCKRWKLHAWEFVESFTLFVVGCITLAELFDPFPLPVCAGISLIGAGFLLFLQLESEREYYRRREGGRDAITNLRAITQPWLLTKHIVKMIVGLFSWVLIAPVVLFLGHKLIEASFFFHNPTASREQYQAFSHDWSLVLSKYWMLTILLGSFAIFLYNAIFARIPQREALIEEYKLGLKKRRSRVLQAKRSDMVYRERALICARYMPEKLEQMFLYDQDLLREIRRISPEVYEQHVAPHLPQSIRLPDMQLDAIAQGDKSHV